MDGRSDERGAEAPRFFFTYHLECHDMAWYVVTDRSDSNWDDTHKYKYRYESRDGSKVAQDEFELRKKAGRPAFLWR